jgi:hypothetical protein
MVGSAIFIVLSMPKSVYLSSLNNSSTSIPNLRMWLCAHIDKYYEHLKDRNQNFSDYLFLWFLWEKFAAQNLVFWVPFTSIGESEKGVFKPYNL